MSIACNELQQTINSLLISFKDCNKIKNSDLRRLVDLSVSLYACSNGGGGETGDIQHNATENIQGGSLFERFHLTQEQYNNLEFLTNKVDSLDDEGYTEGDDFISFYTTVKAVNDGLNLKVDKVVGKSLVLDTEINKLVNLDNTKDVDKPVSIAQNIINNQKLDKGNFVGTAETLNTKIDSILTNSTVVNGVTTSSPVPPTGNIHAIGVGPGTYTNWGGMVIPANNLGTLQRVDGVYSVNLTPIVFTEYLKILDGNKINHYSISEQKYSKRNQYDRFSILNNRIPQVELYATQIPDYLIITYSCIIWTNYVEQNNKLIEAIEFASDSYWGNNQKYSFKTSINSFNTTTLIEQDSDRAAKTTFTLILNGYIIPDSINKFNATNLNKIYSKSTINISENII